MHSSVGLSKKIRPVKPVEHIFASVDIAVWKIAMKKKCKLPHD
jgi:hypothetical protein